MVLRLFVICTIVFCCVKSTAAQSQIRTDMPVPPLQWLNITSLMSGAPPQPLKDSSIGYDQLTRSVIIFGGESQAGVPQQNTYLLNVDTLTWSTPSSKVPSQSSSPPARSRALGTGDFAVNRFAPWPSISPVPYFTNMRLVAEIFLYMEVWVLTRWL